jgi:putative ABC transport system permease protein
MSRLREWIVRFGGLFNKGRKDAELEEEIASHLQMHIEDNVRMGMTPEAARRQALIQLGGIESTKEAYRDQRSLPWLETLAQDLRYGTRVLCKNPGFTMVALLTLALGLGANTAIFSVVHGVLLKPLAYREPEGLVTILHEGRNPVAPANYLDWRLQSRSFSGMSVAEWWGGTLTGGDRPETVPGLRGDVRNSRGSAAVRTDLSDRRFSTGKGPRRGFEPSPLAAPVRQQPKCDRTGHFAQW